MKGSQLFADAILQSSAPAEFLGSVIQASTEYSIIAKDPNGVIILWNEGARRLYGYEAHEVIGKSADLLHAPEDLALGLPGKMRETALREGRWEGILSRITKDQLRITAKIVMTPRFDAKGQPVGFLLMSKDITAEYHLREKLQRTKMIDLDAFGTSAEDIVEFVVTLLQASTEYSIIGLDLVGNIVLWNEGARLLYGYEPWEVVGSKNVEILSRESDRIAGLPRRILDKARQDGVWSGQLSRVTKTGKFFNVHVVVTPRYDAERTLRGYLMISHPTSPTDSL